MISQQPTKIIVKEGSEVVEINEVFTFISKFKPIADGGGAGFEQRFVSCN